MATTGLYFDDPQVAEITAEAWERAGQDPKVIEADHIRSIRRSMGYVLSKWSNHTSFQWTFNQVQHTVSVGEKSFTLPEGTIEAETVVLRRPGGNDFVDTEMFPISRGDYLLIHDKDHQGRPDRYFIDRKRDTDAATRVEVFYWQAAENDTDVIVMDTYRRIQSVGNAKNTLDIPFRFQDAFAAALAARLALKYNLEKYVLLKQIADQEFQEAKDEDRDRGPLSVSVSYEHRYYGRR